MTGSRCGDSLQRGPKVSVIVLAYNQEATVARTLEAVLSQKTPFNYEVIIGEDCSKDSTRDICTRFAALYPERVRLMPPAPNKGIVDNYFDCLSAARGEYIADCAGDDYWVDSHALRVLVDALDSCPQATVASGRCDASSGTGRRALLPGRKVMARQLNSVRRPVITLSASIYRRATAIGALGEEGSMVRNRAFGCEDLPLLMALLKRGDAIMVDWPILCYDSHPGEIPARISSLPEWHRTELAMRSILSKHYGIKRAETAWFQLYARLRLMKYRLRNIFLRGRGV